jgi:pimeloyl-ACP methyl ester carboxylesterase
VQDPRNARALAAAIPGAQLRIWPDAGHVYATDEPEADDEIAHFLAHRTAPLAGTT